MKMNGTIAKKIIKIGLPLGAMQAVFSAQAVIVQALMNSMGAVVVTTFTAVMRVDGFIMMPNFTFATAVHHLYRAEFRRERSWTVSGKGHRDTHDHRAHIVSLILVVCLLLFGRQLMGVFTDTEAVVALGARCAEHSGGGLCSLCGAANLCRAL